MKKLITGLIILGLGIGFPTCLGTFLIETPNPEDNIIESEGNDDLLLTEEVGHNTKIIKKPKYPIIATIDFHPEVINFKSKGNWVTVYISLPDDYDVNNVNMNTVFLNGDIPASTKTEIIDINNDNIPDLMVKFNRTLVKNGLEPQEFCNIIITGEMIEGNEFKGIDIIKLIHY
ncbi:MAG: hypothetical protein ACFFB8_19065 [Promethearchaeota archaeon]